MTSTDHKPLCGEGGSLHPCSYAGWVSIAPLSDTSAVSIVCGRHYRSVTVAMMRTHRMLIVKELNQ